jgi:hypothetical protein
MQGLWKKGVLYSVCHQNVKWCRNTFNLTGFLFDHLTVKPTKNPTKPTTQVLPSGKKWCRGLYSICPITLHIQNKVVILNVDIHLQGTSVTQIVTYSISVRLLVTRFEARNYIVNLVPRSLTGTFFRNPSITKFWNSCDNWYWASAWPYPFIDLFNLVSHKLYQLTYY